MYDQSWGGRRSCIICRQIGLTAVRLINPRNNWGADLSVFIDNFLARCGTHLSLLTLHCFCYETHIQDEILLLFHDRPLACRSMRCSPQVSEEACLCSCSQPCYATSGSKRSETLCSVNFQRGKRIYRNVLSSASSIDIDCVSIAIHIVIVFDYQHPDIVSVV